MQQSLHIQPSTGSHTIFVNDEEEAKSFDPSAYFETPEWCLERKFNRPRSKDLECQSSLDSLLVKGDHPESLSNLKELVGRLEREKKLSVAERELQLQKNLLGKGIRKKMGYDSNGLSIYKWKQQRKK